MHNRTKPGQDRPLPDVPFTISGFQTWCELCGHYRELAAIERFKQFKMGGNSTGTGKTDTVD